MVNQNQFKGLLLLFLLLFVIIGFWTCEDDDILVEDLIDLNENHYSAFKINDAFIKNSGSDSIIKNFLHDISSVQLRLSSVSRESVNYEYRIELENKAGSKIIILDNKALIYKNRVYKITQGTIHAEKYYEQLKSKNQ